MQSLLKEIEQDHYDLEPRPRPRRAPRKVEIIEDLHEALPNWPDLNVRMVFGVDPGRPGGRVSCPEPADVELLEDDFTAALEAYLFELGHRMRTLFEERVRHWEERPEGLIGQAEKERTA